MTVIEALLLGILQGITEFLPISSSGHLVLGQRLLGVDTPGLLFEVVVHLGSLLSIIVVFRAYLLELLFSWRTAATRQLVMTVVIATIPAVLVGVFLNGVVNSAFDSIKITGGALVFTGATLIATVLIKRGQHPVTVKRGTLIGIAQALAITPGISRSGITISAALFLGIDATTAARFSFLLALPAIAGAGLLTAVDLAGSHQTLVIDSGLLVGFLSSFVVGIAALKLLLNTLSSGKFHWFGIYCLGLGILTLFS